MTEQIMINNVDVSECEFFADNYCTLSNDRNERLSFCEKCSEYSDCHYKQLQRKTAECEQLKQELTELKKSGSELLAEKNAFEIGVQQWRDKAKYLENKLQIAKEALENIVDRQNQCIGCADYEDGYCFGTNECWSDDIKEAKQALERIEE